MWQLDTCHSLKVLDIPSLHTRPQWLILDFGNSGMYTWYQSLLTENLSPCFTWLTHCLLVGIIFGKLCHNSDLHSILIRSFPSFSLLETSIRTHMCLLLLHAWASLTTLWTSRDRASATDPDDFSTMLLAFLHLFQIPSQFLFSTHGESCSSLINPYFTLFLFAKPWETPILSRLPNSCLSHTKN